MWSSDKNFQARGFLTPQPPAMKKTQSNAIFPMSERKRISPASNGDCFHVVHKVPATDSPYGRAKHVQLIDKDPSKAISLFWAAINAGDRVDSALKDMAIIMKQLNRSDEAIEAIKSFRHLCHIDSQESLDNVLVELYKRSGRVDEEIQILQNKLMHIDGGTVFGGKKTKIARSQGKKVQITIEQEKSRILGNLAWAYLQQHNYGIAEQHYRRALSLEPDKNKQCNLAICLMHMNRISEAKSLLEDVNASAGTEPMNESYAKSYERSYEMLMQAELQSKLDPVVVQEPDKEKETRRCPTSYRDTSLKEAGVFLPRNEDNVPWSMDRRLPHADDQNGYDDTRSQCTPIGLRGSLQSTPQTMSTEKWRKGLYFDSPSEGSVYTSKVKESWRYTTGQEVGSAHKNTYASLAATRKSSEKVLLTQPRRCLYGFNTPNQRRGGRWGEDTVRNSIRKLSFEQTVINESVPPTPLSNVKEGQPRNTLFCKLSSNENLNVDDSEIGLEKPANASPNKKTWADMVEEEEEEKDYLEESFDEHKEEEFNDENVNSNITYQHPDHSEHHIKKITLSSKGNRLQVFRDITST